MADQSNIPRPGDLSWRLSSHPITLLCFLTFRISSLLVYLFGLWTTSSLYVARFAKAPWMPTWLILLLNCASVLIFIITMLLLAADFYYLKNIAGRRLVGLRWWNEVNTSTGDSHWVFESQDRSGSDGGVVQNATDKRFFWLALYLQPALWVGLAIFALVRLESPIWLFLIVIALVLTVTNTMAFSRCDKFSQASTLASSAIYGSGLAKNVAGNMFSRLFNR